MAKTYTIPESYDFCRAVAKREAKNFYHSFLLLPPEKRKAIHAVYAFTRAADDIADGPGEPDSKKRRFLDMRERLRDLSGSHAGAISADPRVFIALADTVAKFRIQVSLLEEILAGMEQDVDVTRYHTFDELRGYCYLAASAVGLVTLEIFEYKDKAAVPHAIDLGYAMQLTNILRDVKEDLDRGRVYLPQEDLAKFGCTEDDLLRGTPTDAFRNLMRFEIARAREFFRSGEKLLPYLPVRSRFCPAALAAVYSKILDEIEARNFDVFRERISLPKMKKIRLCFSAWLKSLMTRGSTDSPRAEGMFKK